MRGTTTRPGDFSELMVTRELVTTNHIRGETWTVTLKRHHHAAARRALRTLEGHTNRFVAVPSIEEEEALAWLAIRTEVEFSFVDATSFVVMDALAIYEAFSFDSDFERAGYYALRA